MGKLTNLVIHCADTGYTQKISADDLTLWHLGVKKSGSTYTYLGKNYTEAELKNKKLTLPSGKTVDVLKTNGNGWSVVGYSDFVDREGNLINLVPYDFDSVVDKWELTNGASGHNSTSRHICLAGGWSKDGKIKNGKNPDGSYFKPEELYTKEQIDTLKSYINMQLEIQPDLNVCGHNNLSSKTCPNFDVKEFVKHIDD